MYTLKFKASVEKDFKKIGKEAGLKILKQLRTKLVKNPKLGIPLKGQNRVLWRYRIDDYRVIYTFNETEIWVLILHVAHRKEVYRILD